MNSRLHALLADRRGVTAIEFALIAPLLLLVTLGSIETARMLWTQAALDATAIQTVRCIGVLSSSCASGGTYSSANATSYAETVASGFGINLTTSEITLSAAEASGACAGLSEVSIIHSFVTAIPALLTMLSSGEALSGQACFPNQS